MANNTRDPFRRQGPNLPLAQKPRVTEKINPEFKDISDRESMAEFIKQNSHVLKNQDAEIDNVETQSQLPPDTEPLIHSRRPPPNTRQYQPPPRPQQIQREQNNNVEDPDDGYELVRVPKRKILTQRPTQEEQFTGQEQQEVEEVALQRPSPQQNQNQNNNNTSDDAEITEDDLPFKVSNNLPEAVKKRMIESYKKERELIKARGADPNAPKKIISNVDNLQPIGDVEPGTATGNSGISEVEMRRKIEAEILAKISKGERPDLEPPVIPMRFNLKPTRAVNDSKFVRFEPVSGMTFYDTTELHIRKLNIVEAINVTEAQTAEDITSFIDALAPSLYDFDIRELTYPDFRHLLYWHWLNSYVKSPHDLRWESKYGNQNTYTVKESNLRMKTPKITRADYIENWLSRGFQVPTMREAEVIMKENLNDKEYNIFRKAQFFAYHDQTDRSIQSRIDNMVDLSVEHGIELIEEIPDFIKAIEHHIIEFIDVKDEKFNANSWLETLKTNRRDNQQDVDNENIPEEDRAIARETVIELDVQIKELTEKLERKEVVQPDVESIRIDRQVLRFFPVI